MSPRILAVLDTYPALSETFLYTTLQNLREAGYQVSIRARRRGKATPASSPPNVRYLPSEDWPLLFKLALLVWYALRLLVCAPGLFARALRFLRKQPGGMRRRSVLAYRIFPLLCEKADVTYLSFGGLAVKFLEYIELHPNVVFSLRGSDINIEPLLSEEYAKRLKAALRAARGVHCVCRDIQNKAMQLSGEGEEKFSVIYTALNPLFLQDTPSRRPDASSRAVRIVSVGRLDWRKGLEHGMVAMRALFERGIVFSWMIIGEGEYRTALAWAIRDMQLEAHVNLVGGKSQAEIRTLLSESDIFFHPTVHEGISNAVLEAMALGLPVVVSAVGGMGEVIANGETGALVPPRDWRAIADALERLACDPDLRQRLGDAARAYAVETFSSSRQMAGFHVFLQRAVLHD